MASRIVNVACILGLSAAFSALGPVTASQAGWFGFGKSEGTKEAKPAPAPRKEEFFCPKVVVQPGTAAFTLYERGNEGNPLSVRYQARFNEFARECVDLGAEVGIRIGISGRALVGPAGAAGQNMEVPIRFVVLDDNRKVILSELTKLQVTIPVGQTGVTFSHVEELGGVPMPQNRLRGWDFRVGFETKPGAAPQG